MLTAQFKSIRGGPQMVLLKLAASIRLLKPRRQRSAGKPESAHKTEAAKPESMSPSIRMALTSKSRAWILARRERKTSSPAWPGSRKETPLNCDSTAKLGHRSELSKSNPPELWTSGRRNHVL